MRSAAGTWSLVLAILSCVTSVEGQPRQPDSRSQKELAELRDQKLKAKFLPAAKAS